MDLVPLGQAGVLGIVRYGAIFEAGDPGIVDQHVDRRESLRQHVPAGLARNVERVPFAAQFPGGALARLLVDIGEDDARAFGQESFAHGLADAARTAGYHAEHVVQFLH